MKGSINLNLQKLLRKGDDQFNLLRILTTPHLYCFRHLIPLSIYEVSLPVRSKQVSSGLRSGSRSHFSRSKSTKTKSRSISPTSLSLSGSLVRH
uniref:Uncharacterized protein n=1 Tax=Salix viminalis TaxID=40686 RepID=A0A6N2KJV8_SALVM